MLVFPDPNDTTEYTDPNGSVWEFNGTGWVRQPDCSGSGGGGGGGNIGIPIASSSGVVTKYEATDPNELGGLHYAGNASKQDNCSGGVIISDTEILTKTYANGSNCGFFIIKHDGNKVTGSTYIPKPSDFASWNFEMGIGDSAVALTSDLVVMSHPSEDAFWKIERDGNGTWSMSKAFDWLESGASSGFTPHSYSYQYTGGGGYNNDRGGRLPVFRVSDDEFMTVYYGKKSSGPEPMIRVLAYKIDGTKTHERDHTIANNGYMNSSTGKMTCCFYRDPDNPENYFGVARADHSQGESSFFPMYLMPEATNGAKAVCGSLVRIGVAEGSLSTFQPTYISRLSTDMMHFRFLCAGGNNGWYRYDFVCPYPKNKLELPISQAAMKVYGSSAVNSTCYPPPAATNRHLGGDISYNTGFFRGSATSAADFLFPMGFQYGYIYHQTENKSQNAGTMAFSSAGFAANQLRSSYTCAAADLVSKLVMPIRGTFDSVSYNLSLVAPISNEKVLMRYNTGANANFQIVTLEKDVPSAFIKVQGGRIASEVSRSAEDSSYLPIIDQTPAIDHATHRYVDDPTFTVDEENQVVYMVFGVREATPEEKLEEQSE